MVIIPSIIKFKRGGPTLPSVLANGEPAFNLSNGRFYIGTGQGWYEYYNTLETPFIIYRNIQLTSGTSIKVGLTSQIPVSDPANKTALDFRAYAPNQAATLGDDSTLFGYDTKATGTLATVFGDTTTAETYGVVTMGRANTPSTGSAGTYSATQNALVIGNGSPYTIYTNAFRVSYDGKVYGLSAFNSTGADYAEYFEWLDGNKSNEDRIGKFVKLNKDRIEIANESDEVLGVVSGTCAIIGNAHSDGWKDIYMRDDFGRIIYDTSIDDEGKEVKNMRINPNYDPSIEYTPREQRKEWDTIGLLGRLRVIDNGSCQENGYCKCGKDGIAVHSEKGYRVLKRVSDNVIEILFK